MKTAVLGSGPLVPPRALALLAKLWKIDGAAQKFGEVGFSKVCVLKEIEVDPKETPN